MLAHGELIRLALPLINVACFDATQSYDCLAYTGALNFKDVMLAYGKLNRDMMSNGYVGCKLGFEFSGLLQGKRVMGVAKQAIATHVFARDFLVSPPFHPSHPCDLLASA